MPFPTERSIPAIIIGVHHSTATEISPVFSSTPYYVIAILDLEESPAAYQYSAHNLGVILHGLHPQPQVLITGTAVERIVPEVKPVWEEYAAKTLKAGSEHGESLFVPPSKFHSEDGPPLPGTVEYLLSKLDAVFKPIDK